MTTLFERFRRYVEDRRLLVPGETVVVGYSGGADSGALLHLLLKFGAKPIAAHLNHGLRALAHWDEELARAMAVRIGIPFVSDRVNVAERAERDRLSIEEAGRIERYEFLHRVACEFGASLIATAHTLDDHVETAMLHFARGTGTRGLCGIPVRRGPIVRPLLYARRTETRSYCLANGISWVEEPSNIDPSYARVRARRSFLPAFESLHGEAMQNAARAMEILREEDLYLDVLARELLERAAVKPSDPLAPLYSRVYERYRAETLLEAPLALRRRAVVRIIRRFGASPAWSYVESTLKVLEERASVAVNPSPVVSLYCKGENLVVRRTDAQSEFCQEWSEGIVVTGTSWKLTSGSQEGSTPGIRCRLNSEGMKQPAFVRYLSREDVLETKDGILQPWNVLKKRGVPKPVRQRTPVLFDNLGVLWVPTVGVSARVLPQASARSIEIALEFLAESSEGILGV